MALSIRQKRVRRISGVPVHGVAVQGAMDGPATCNQLGWRFGTWNAGSLSGRSGEVVDELWRRRVDVCAVQETRWKGEAAKFVGAKGRRYKLWWKGDNGTGGVGVMVKVLMNKVVEVRRKSARVIVVVMVIAKVMVRVISGYAPHQRMEEEKYQFYDDVSEEIGQAASDEFVMLLGDLNGHVGANAEGYEGDTWRVWVWSKE
jgi:exonuclease III